MTWRSLLGTLILSALVIGCSARPSGPDGARGTRLTAEEVRATFVGKRWEGSSGVFLFLEDGTYTYKSTKTTTEWGPWRYTINQDGSVTGATATYTFYRIGSAFRYHNSESNEFYLALPVKDG